MESQDPFRDTTNVVKVDSTSSSSSKGKQVLIAGEAKFYPIEEKNAIQMTPSQRKHYRDRERYLQMTPAQREAYLQRNRNYKRLRRDDTASRDRSDISTPDQLKICHPKSGTRFKISPSGIYVSLISSEDQAANNNFTNLGMLKRHHGTNVYSEQTSEHGEIFFQESRDYKKRRKSDTGYRNNLHEDTIYVPTDSFPAMQDNMQSEDKIEYDNLDGEFLTYRGQSSEFEAFVA